MSLMDQYPAFWRQSVPTVTIIDAMGPEAQTLRAALADLLAQCNVETATWGLELWEKQLGLETEANKTDSDRRARIKSKLRGTGTVTVAMIQNMAQSFSNGEVEVLEDPARYHFDIRFVGSRGIPPNMDDLTAALEEIKPAHLTYAYIYVYNTYGFWTEYTHAQMAAYTHWQLREEVLKKWQNTQNILRSKSQLRRTTTQ